MYWKKVSHPCHAKPSEKSYFEPKITALVTVASDTFYPGSDTKIEASSLK